MASFKIVPFEIERRQIGVFFLRSAIIDRASKKKRRDGVFQLKWWCSYITLLEPILA